MAYIFEFIQNVYSQKVAAVAADGMIRQFDLNERNMRSSGLDMCRLFLKCFTRGGHS
jgi:hypothetical protein